MKLAPVLCALAALAAASIAPAADGPSLSLGDFQDSADLKRWTGGDSGAVEMTRAPRSVTDANMMLKVVLKSGDYPGISLRDVPREWSKYEAVRFVVWTDSPFKLHVRIDDGKSSDYTSRFNKSFDLQRGRNLCQILVSDVSRVLNVKDMRAFILFGVRPPSGLTLWLDDVALGPRLAEKVPFIPYAKRKDLAPTLKVVTPHLPFARRLAGGPVRAFMISGIRCGREVCELMQRLDLKVSLMTWDPAWDQNTWGMGDFYGRRGHAFDRVLMQRYLASSMQGPEEFDVMIVPTPIGWDQFPPGAREALIARVRDRGEGLVLIHPFPGKAPWPKDLAGLSALVDCQTDFIDPASGYLRHAKPARVRGKKWLAKGDHPIARGVPFDALPHEALTYVKYKLATDAKAVVVSATGEPIVAVRKVGKGRVVTCAWDGSVITPSIARAAGAAPVRGYRYWEVMYSLIGRCALWAAGREMTAKGKPVPLAVTGPHADPCLSAVQYKDARGRVTDWALRFAPPGADGIARLVVKVPAQVKRGDRVRIRVARPVALKGKAVAWEAVLGERVAGRWRTLERFAALTGGTSKGFDVPLPSGRVRQVLAIVKVTGQVDGKVVARGAAEVVVTPPGPGSPTRSVALGSPSRWDDYEIFMWPVGGLAFLRDFESDLMRQAGSTGVMDTRWNNRGRLLRWARAGLRILPHAIDGNNLHIRPYRFAEIAKKYTQTKDKAHLIRPPSYADPAFLAATRKRMVKAAELLSPFGIPAYVLCDEPSLTSYRAQFDFDFHPANVAGFRKALAAQFGTVKAMNAALGTKAASIAAVAPPTTAEARKAGNWGLWNAWRAHNDTVMAEGYRMYRDAFRRVDPAAAISISGTQAANPFDGFDWAKLSPLFDAMNGYGYSEQERKRMSFHPTMKNAKPAGYGNTGKGVTYQLWSCLADHGGGHVLFWWVSFRNPDLSFCRSALDYRKGFAELAGGIGRQYQLGRRHTSPVAIQYSMNSLRAAWTAGKNYHAATGQVAAALVALGLDPLFVSDEQIAAGDLTKRGFKAVFLPLPASLGRGEKKGGLDVDGALAKFAAAGGLIVATAEPTHDEFLQPAKPDAALMKKIKRFDAVKDRLGKVLAAAGVRPWVPVRRGDGKPVPGASVTVHKLSGKVPAYIVTILRRPVGKKQVVGADGVLTYVDDPSGGNAIEACTADVSALAVAYATAFRTGKALPVANGRIALNAPDGDAVALALLPYAVKDVRLAARVVGRDLEISWRLTRADGKKAFAPHAVRIDVAADGQADAALSRNATCDADRGAGRVRIPLAAEDAGRKLTIAVKDVLTAARASAAVTVPDPLK